MRSVVLLSLCLASCNSSGGASGGSSGAASDNSSGGAPGGASGHLARVRAAGVLRWGGDLAGGEPYVYEDPEHPGQLGGFEVEIADAIARELGVHARFAQNEWSQLVPSLERGGFDVILNGLEATPRNRRRLDITRAYYRFEERLVVRRDDARWRTAASPGPGLASPALLAALAARRVGTLSNSLAQDLLAGAHAEVVLYDGVDTPYDDLRNGRTDAVLLDDIIADRYGLRHAELVSAGDVASGRYAIGCPRGDAEFRDAVDGALGRVIASGELRRILEGHHLWNERQVELAAAPQDDDDDADDDDHAGATMAATRDGASRSNASVAGLRWNARTLWLFLEGALYTLAISTAAMALAVPFGLLLAVARRYGPRAVAAAAASYIELYRGTPVLLQLYVLYFGLADVVRFGPVTAAIVGLGMNYAAYEAEVYRAGIQAVPAGQMEAALALGMTLRQALRRVLLPQAFRFALPSVTNDFIALLKDSSLVSVITVVELTKRTQIAAIDGRSWLAPGLLCAGMYFAMSYPLSRWARRLEARA